METPVKPSTAINKSQPALTHSCVLGLEPLEAEGGKGLHGCYPDKVFPDGTSGWKLRAEVEVHAGSHRFTSHGNLE